MTTMTKLVNEMILVLDFGSQYNQLITRRIREFGVYSELHPHTLTAEEIKEMNPKGIILQADRTVYMMKDLSAVTKKSLNSIFLYWASATVCS